MSNGSKEILALEPDSPGGYRNGYGKPRRLSTSCGTIKVRRPRVRGLEERFESRVLPLFARRTKAVGDLLPDLYLHGLAQGDFELSLRALLGEGAPLSPTSIARLRGKWETDFQDWKERRLDDRELVYAWPMASMSKLDSSATRRVCWSLSAR